MSLYVDSLRGTAWDSRSFFHQLTPCLFLQREVVGTYLPGTGTPCWGAWFGDGTPHSWDIPSKFLSIIRGCGISLFLVFVPLASLNGCGFLNSIVIRLLFISILWLSDFHSTRFLMVLSDVVFFSCNFVDVVVQRGEPCLPMPPYCLEVLKKSFSFKFLQIYTQKFICYIYNYSIDIHIEHCGFLSISDILQTVSLLGGNKMGRGLWGLTAALRAWGLCHCPAFARHPLVYHKASWWKATWRGVWEIVRGVFDGFRD